MKKIGVITLAIFFLFACKEEDAVKNSEVWQLDNYTVGSSKTFRAGFVQNEEAVVVLGRKDVSYRVNKIMFMFGGQVDTQFLKVKIYRDKEDGDSQPGSLLYEGNHSVPADNENLHTIDIRASNVTVTGGGSIRVALHFDHNGLPSAAYDANMDHPDKNLMNNDGIWVKSNVWQIDGDWIIRAEIKEL